MNNYVLGKSIENVKSRRAIKLVTAGKKRNELLSGSNYHATKMLFRKTTCN